MKRTYKKTLALTLVLILLIQLCPIPIARAASTPPSWNISDIPYSNKFVELYQVGDGYVALDKDGDLWAWGYNTNGIFGNGTTTGARDLPQKISINAKFKQLSTGNTYWIALDTNGNVWGCGYQLHAELGNGLEFNNTQTFNDYVVSTPIQITSGTKYTKVVATYTNVLALDANGNIWGWGHNNSGTLMSEGKGDYLYSDDYYINRPKQLTSSKKYKDIDSNGATAGAIDESNNLYMWGRNQYCQLAAPSEEYEYVIQGSSTSYRIPGSYNPVQVKAGMKFSKVSIGGWGVAALDTDGLYWRWGLVTEIGMSESSASKLEGYDSSAKALYEPYNNGTTKYADVYSAGSDVIYLKIADNQGSASNKIFVIGNNKDYYGNTEDEYGNKFGGVIEQLNGFTIIGPGLALDENGYMWRWGFEYINSEGARVKAEEPIQITGERYTVTFKDGNTVLKTESVVAGGTAEAPANPTKTGYTFKGWDKAFTNVTSDLTVNATWEANVYNVTLETNDGKINSGNISNYTYGVGATLPTDVTKTGFTFAGWYENANLSGTPVTQISTTATGNKTYYAKWNAGTATAYKVEHYKQNLETNTYDKVESDTENLAGTTGATATARAKSYEGYHENTTHADRVASGEIKADGTLVLKLYYDVNEYTVTFVSDGRTLSTQTIKHGRGAQAPENPTKTGYTFKGWDKTFDNVTSNLEVNATWEANVYNVTLETNGGKINSGNISNYTYGVGATLPTDVTKTGFTFAGWYENEDLLGTPVTQISTTATENKTYYAKWDAATNTSYTVEHYKQNLETNTYDKVENDTEHLTGTTGATVEATVKSYEGYHENITHAGRVASGEIKADGTLVLKLYYDVNEYTVTFISDGQTISTQTIKHGGTAQAPSISKQGYTLSWDKPFNNVTSNLTVNAIWTEGTGTAYTVEHYKQNTELNGYELVTEDVKHLTGTTGATATVIGKTYEGFTENLTHPDRVASGEIKADGSLVLRLYYDRNSYKVNLDTNGGSIKPEDEIKDYTYGIEEKLPTPEKEGYTFIGWYTNPEFEGEKVDKIEPGTTGDREYYAKWEINKYTVTFVSDGETVKTETVAYGGTAQAPSISKQGYTLSWDKPFNNVTSNLTVNAVWTQGTGTAYTVEHYKQNTNLNGYDLVTEDVKHLTGTTGATATVIGKTYEGFTENLTHPNRVASGEIKADGSLVLRLYYDRNSYKVNLDTNGGSIKPEDEIKDYTYGIEEKLPIPEKEGYIFDGWYDNSEFTGEKVETITNVTGDKEYYAKWKISEYTVTFVNDGKTVKTETIEYGGKATAPVLTRTGYILSWDKDFSNVKSDLTVTAVWTEDKDTDTTSGGKLPQTGETYIIAGTISVLISIAAFIYLKYRKINNM